MVFTDLHFYVEILLMSTDHDLIFSVELTLILGRRVDAKSHGNVWEALARSAKTNWNRQRNEGTDTPSQVNTNYYEYLLVRP